jgi:homoserine kinase type II
VILKLVGRRDPFVAGLEIADLIAPHIRSGPPLRTLEGGLALETDDGWLALLRREPGRPLRLLDDSDRRRWGARLGDLHRRLIDVATTEPLPVWPWDWLDVDADHLRGETVLRNEIARARETAERFVDRDGSEISVIHGDPNPKEFLLDPAGNIAIVDWGAVQNGPLIYDVASARWFAGSDESFRPALDAYRQSSGFSVPPDGLRVFLRYREAVQAWYFSLRLARHDTTGADAAFNRAGLADARAALARLSSV